MYLKNFDQKTTFRFAEFDLVRNQWRRYIRDLTLPGLVIPPEDPSNTLFDVFA